MQNLQVSYQDDYSDHMYTATDGYLTYGVFLDQSWKWDYVKTMPAWKLTTPPNTLAHQHEEAKPIVILQKN